MNRTLLIAIAAVVLIGGGAAWYFTQGTAPSTTEIETPDAPDTEIDTSRVVEMTLGNPDAEVTVIEYASFTCPHCRDFHNNAYQDLKAD